MIRWAALHIAFWGYTALCCYLIVALHQQPQRSEPAVVPVCADPRIGEPDYNPCDWVPFIGDI